MKDEFGDRVQLLDIAEKARSNLLKEFYNEVLYEGYTFDELVEDEDLDKETIPYFLDHGVKASISNYSITITCNYNEYIFRRHRDTNEYLKMEQNNCFLINRRDTIAGFRKLLEKMEEEEKHIGLMTPRILEWMYNVGY